jgi:hypothetical protein
VKSHLNRKTWASVFMPVIPATVRRVMVQVSPGKKQDPTSKITKAARHQWLIPVILATQEAEIRRIKVGGQPRQIVCKTLS